LHRLARTPGRFFALRNSVVCNGRRKDIGFDQGFRRGGFFQGLVFAPRMPSKTPSAML